jgi:hypothetical protein
VIVEAPVKMRRQSKSCGVTRDVGLATLAALDRDASDSRTLFRLYTGKQIFLSQRIIKEKPCGLEVILEPDAD